MSDRQKARPWLAVLAWAVWFGLYLYWGNRGWDPKHLTGWQLLSHGIAASAIGTAFGLAAWFVLQTRVGPRPYPGETDAKRRQRRWKTRFHLAYMGTYLVMSLALYTFGARPIELMTAFGAFMLAMYAFGFRGFPSIPREQPLRPDSDVVSVHSEPRV